MLVFISDVHFVDETAIKDNIPASAFDTFLREVGAIARNERYNIDEVKLVFLGDIFDLIRTEKWFEVPEEHRPWGEKAGSAEMKEKALEILKQVTGLNKEALELFSDESLKKEEYFGTGLKVTKLYVTGNHDRLCAFVPELGEEVVRALGLDTDDGNFEFKYTDEDYGVYALHGHIFDSYNYEDDYKSSPIGDAITTELVAKLPYALIPKVRAAGILGEKDLKELERNFREIENVRPLSATAHWLTFQVQAMSHVDRLREIIDKTVHEVAGEFLELWYVKRWLKKHKWYNPFGDGGKLWLALKALKSFHVMTTLKVVGLVGKFAGGDDLLKAAKKLVKKNALPRGTQYVVMGHTHDPLNQALVTDTDGTGRVNREDVYVNTGTWRKRFHKCDPGKGFIGWKDMTYAIFYTKEERPNARKLPVFETWTGSLKKEEESET